MLELKEKVLICREAQTQCKMSDKGIELRESAGQRTHTRNTWWPI